jgi:GrpB-like predicted nucleotidyltransferase (UPF0157 family)
MPNETPPDEPIALAPPSLEYKARFEEERLRVAIGIGRLAAAIEHVGSTAITGVQARPIIDLLIGLRALPLDGATEPLRALGYEPAERFGADRLVFRRGQPRAYDAHVVLHDGAEWRRLVIFRDWLNLHPQWARDYEALKIELMARSPGDRAALDAAKAAFVTRAVEEASRYPALRLRRL